jgi:hypothetical protein
MGRLYEDMLLSGFTHLLKSSKHNDDHDGIANDNIYALNWTYSSDKSQLFW